MSFAACLLVGYHAMTGTPEPMLGRRISSSVVLSIKVNGFEMPESGLNAAIADC